MMTWEQTTVLEYHCQCDTDPDPAHLTPANINHNQWNDILHWYSDTHYSTPATHSHMNTVPEWGWHFTNQYQQLQEAEIPFPHSFYSLMHWGEESTNKSSFKFQTLWRLDSASTHNDSCRIQYQRNIFNKNSAKYFQGRRIERFREISHKKILKRQAQLHLQLSMIKIAWNCLGFNHELMSRESENF